MKEEILKALSYVEDPDLKKDLVSLNMIQNLMWDSQKVMFDLVLTTPACPMKEMLHNACVNAIHTMVDKNLEVIINITSKVTSNRPEQSIMQGVKNVIAVASGKGGVGKSTVAVNLARALKQTGASVGILDADIHGPSVPVLMGVEEEKPVMNGEQMDPVFAEGIAVMSIGFLVPKGQAIVWRGPMLASALKQFGNDVNWGELDYLIVDLPPGTGDVHLSLIQLIPLNGVVIVTTPDEVAVTDARKAIDMYRNPQLEQEILGVVENMAFFQETPESKKHFLFGKEGGSKLAAEFNLDLLTQVPLREARDFESYQKEYLELAGKLAQKLAIKSSLS